MREFAAYYHTHWDREWYLPFRQYQVRLAEVVDDLIEKLESGQLPCFMLDGQVAVLEDYLALRPANRERLKKLIVDGRVDVGPWYVMPDEFLVGGESLLRNLVLGLEQSKAWGCHQFTGYLPDTFGHSADIPTLLAGCGLNSAIVWRGISPKQSIFSWKSPSGATLPTLHLTDGYFQISPDDWTLDDQGKLGAIKALAERLSAASPDDVKPLFPVGGDHFGIVTAEGQQRLKDLYPTLLETTPARYMDDVRKANPAALQNVALGELADHQGAFLLPGVYSSRLYLKQTSRRLEHRLVHRLEPLLALVQGISAVTKSPTQQPNYPENELALAWLRLIENHPHDSICGCSVDDVHLENEVRFNDVQQLADVLQDRAEKSITNALPELTAGWIINTGDRSFSGVVPLIQDGIAEALMAPGMLPYALSEAGSLPECPAEGLSWQSDCGHRVLQDDYRHSTHHIPMAHLTRKRFQGWCWVENVPAFGLAQLRTPLPNVLPDSIEPAQATIDGQTGRLENGLLKIELSSLGELTVTDKRTKQRYNKLLQLALHQDQGDSYTAASVPGSKIQHARFVGVELGYQGSLVASLKLTHALSMVDVKNDYEGHTSLQHHIDDAPDELRMTTTILLKADSPLLEFETRFINRALTSHKLQVVFETGQPISIVDAESHFSTVQRQYDPEYRVEDHMPVAAWKELKSNAGPVQRFWSANGHSWITEGLTEYEVSGSTMAITLLRAFTALSAADTGVRGAQAGPPLETFGGTCLDRPFIGRYAWLPTPSERHNLYAQASQFYGNVWAKGTDPDQDISQQQTAQKEKTLLDAGFSLVQWDNPALVMSACHWVPGKGLRLRLLNTASTQSPTTFQTGFKISRCQPVNFVGEVMGADLPISDLGFVTISLQPYDVATFQLYPVLEREFKCKS